MKTNEQDLRELVEDLWSYPFLYVTGLFRDPDLIAALAEAQGSPLFERLFE
jgi:hypothetical protein